LPIQKLFTKCRKVWQNSFAYEESFLQFGVFDRSQSHCFVDSSWSYYYCPHSLGLLALNESTRSQEASNNEAFFISFFNPLYMTAGTGNSKETDSFDFLTRFEGERRSIVDRTEDPVNNAEFAALYEQHRDALAQALLEALKTEQDSPSWRPGALPSPGLRRVLGIVYPHLASDILPSRNGFREQDSRPTL